MIFQSDRQCKPPKLKMLLFTITVNCYCVLICLCELILIEEVYNQCFDETHGISAHIPRCCLCFLGGGDWLHVFQTHLECSSRADH